MRRHWYLLHPQKPFTSTENTSNSLTNIPTQNFTRVFTTSITLTVDNLRWWSSTISCTRPTRRQNRFSENKFSRTMSLNAHYMVLFMNPRDVSQFANLARQMYPKSSQFAVEAYRDVQLSVSRPSTGSGRRVATENKHFSRRDSLRIRSKGIKKVRSSSSSVYDA